MNDVITRLPKRSHAIGVDAIISLGKKRILIVDNDMEFIKSTENLLTDEGFEVTLCHDAINATQLVNQEQHDLILFDIVHPNINGFELLKDLRISNKVPIIILTTRDELFDKIYGLELGADDYLIKPMNQRELLARINAIFRRVKKIEHAKKQQFEDINGISINLATREVYCREHTLQLTGHEFEVLHCLVTNAGRVISKDEIVEHVHGRSMPYNDRSIDMHICNIRKKISLHDPEQKIKTIRSAGYIFINRTQE